MKTFSTLEANKVTLPHPLHFLLLCTGRGERSNSKSSEQYKLDISLAQDRLPIPGIPADSNEDDRDSSSHLERMGKKRDGEGTHRREI